MTQSQISTYEVGDILRYSWGYDQTNVQFFQITRTSDKSVWIKEIESQTAKDAGWNSRWVSPKPDCFLVGSREIRKRKQHYLVMDHGLLKPYEGRPVMETSYH